MLVTKVGAYTALLSYVKIIHTTLCAASLITLLYQVQNHIHNDQTDVAH